MVKNNMINNDDHDLLIELRTEMQGIRKDIKDLKDGTTERISKLENDKTDKKEFDELYTKVNTDIETRVRSLESAKSFYMTSMVIYTAVGLTMISLIIYHMFKG
jgi:hypothetical protein